MEARIPFGGFYESLWSSGIDNEEERYRENLAEEHGILESDIGELLYKHTKYHLAYNQVAKDYVRPFQDFINEGLGLKIKLTFKDMTSPREYNFETDRIFVDISYKDAIILARRVGRKAMRKAVKMMFTSRDGFSSFYDNDLTEWGPLRTWDHNQLYCLFHAALDVIGDDDYEGSLYQDFEFYSAYDLAVDYQTLMLEIGKLVGKKELEEEFKEEEDRRFPVAWHNTRDYVEQYHKLNSNELSKGDY